MGTLLPVGGGGKNNSSKRKKKKRRGRCGGGKKKAHRQEKDTFPWGGGKGRLPGKREKTTQKGGGPSVERGALKLGRKPESDKRGSSSQEGTPLHHLQEKRIKSSLLLMKLGGKKRGKFHFRQGEKRVPLRPIKKRRGGISCLSRKKKKNGQSVLSRPERKERKRTDRLPEGGEEKRISAIRKKKRGNAIPIAGPRR